MLCAVCIFSVMSTSLESYFYTKKSFFSCSSIRQIFAYTYREKDMSVCMHVCIVFLNSHFKQSVVA